MLETSQKQKIQMKRKFMLFAELDGTQNLIFWQKVDKTRKLSVMQNKIIQQNQTFNYDVNHPP